jgi:hypothetical protein
MQESWEALFTGTDTPKDIRERAKCDQSCGIYADSVQSLGQTLFFIAKNEVKKTLVLYGSDEYFDRFEGEEKEVHAKPAKICELNHNNCESIRALFPYVKPISRGDRRFSFGMGDRLGIATPGHIRAVKDLDVFPVLAQQSMRELNLTGRTYQSVLDDVSWAVFQEGYTGGFGADADHLKTKEQVAAALKDGYTMITLDCSDHIDNRFFTMGYADMQKTYAALPAKRRESLEAAYLNKRFEAGDTVIVFDPEKLTRCMLVYGKALAFIENVYAGVILKHNTKVDFEVSIDETSDTTSPEAHYFIANELAEKGVRVDNMAPRFCGEFQKGIDYIGDIAQFEKEYIIHTKIAEHFGYRVSVHSGSDKFSVFPCVGQYSKLSVHVKTAGTSWLEAVRLIAAKNPGLYRRMHAFALLRLNEAKKYYHIGAKPENIPDIDTLSDAELPALMDKDDSRQALHITYGLLLQEKDTGGQPVFRQEIFKTLEKYENEYYSYLVRHMQKHISMLMGEREA